MENWERNQMWNINQGVNNYPPEENKANWLERNVLELHRSFLRFKKDSEQATCYKKLTRGRLGNIQPGDNFLYDGREILRVYTLFFSFFLPHSKWDLSSPTSNGTWAPLFPGHNIGKETLTAGWPGKSQHTIFIFNYLMKSWR